MSKQNEILATIEEFLKDRKGSDFQVSLESDFVRIYRRILLN